MKSTIALVTLGLGFSLPFHFSQNLSAIATPAILVAESSPAPLSLESLKNAQYQIPDYGEITLQDGMYESDTTSIIGAKMTDTIAFGDFNNDGKDDAATILLVRTKESGIMVYLAAVAEREGTPYNVATVFLGDRVQVQELTINQALLQVKMLKSAPQDPLCCPSAEAYQAYRFNPDINELEAETLSVQERKPKNPKVEINPSDNQFEPLSLPETPQTEIKIPF